MHLGCDVEVHILLAYQSFHGRTVGGQRRRSCCTVGGIDLDKWVLILFYSLFDQWVLRFHMARLNSFLDFIDGGWVEWVFGFH